MKILSVDKDKVQMELTRDEVVRIGSGVSWAKETANQLLEKGFVEVLDLMEKIAQD